MSSCLNTTQICSQFGVGGCCPTPSDNEFKQWALQLLCGILAGGGGGGGGRGDSCENSVFSSICSAPTSNGALVSSTVNGLGNVAPGFWTVSFTNIGNADAVVDGSVLPANSSVQFTGYSSFVNGVTATKFLPGISYNASGTTLIIRTFV